MTAPGPLRSHFDVGADGAPAPAPGGAAAAAAAAGAGGGGGGGGGGNVDVASIAEGNGERAGGARVGGTAAGGARSAVAAAAAAATTAATDSISAVAAAATTAATAAASPPLEEMGAVPLPALAVPPEPPPADASMASISARVRNLPPFPRGRFMACWWRLSCSKEPTGWPAVGPASCTSTARALRRCTIRLYCFGLT